MNNYETGNRPAVVVDGNPLFFCIGFCVPVAGLVLFLVWKDERPVDAKYAGLGALIVVIIPMVLYLIMLIFGIAFSLVG